MSSWQDVSKLSPDIHIYTHSWHRYVILIFHSNYPMCLMLVLILALLASPRSSQLSDSIPA